MEGPRLVVTSVKCSLDIVGLSRLFQASKMSLGCALPLPLGEVTPLVGVWRDHGDVLDGAMEVIESHAGVRREIVDVCRAKRGNLSLCSSKSIRGKRLSFCCFVFVVTEV